MKLISVVTPCFNEEENVDALHERIAAVFAGLPGYDWEHVYIDNASSDRTVEKVKGLAAAQPRVKLIVNARNFGHIRSPVHGLLEARGDAVVCMASDLQDPPELLPAFLEKWEQGFKVAVGVKTASRESAAMWLVRLTYYKLIGRISEVQLIENYTGFGLYDREVLEQVRATGDRYPYFRGLIPDLGYPIARIPYTQPNRYRGITKNNFFTLYDMAMLGITSHSKAPIRLATMAGFLLSLVSLLLSVGFFVWKLLNWDRFELGLAPMLIGMFFFSSVQLFFIGLLGEYVAAIHTQVLKRPMVVERERVNLPPPRG
jgi:glycosyltransferase involved in cell wall biosynthesis